MKRRLNILCVIVMLVLGYSVIESAYYMGMGIGLGAKTGWEAAKEMKSPGKLEQHDGYRELANLKFITLIPHSLGGNVHELLCDSVYNTKTGEYVPVAHASMAVSMKTQEGLLSVVLSGLLSLVHLVAVVWSVVLFVKIIVAINRSDIFNWRNVRRLRRLGVLLAIGFGSSLLTGYMELWHLREVFALQHYDLALSDTVNITTFVISFTALIVAEIFAIGLKMKEEQDLTI